MSTGCILANDDLVITGAAQGGAVPAAFLPVKHIPLCDGVFGQVDAPLEVLNFLLTGWEHASQGIWTVGKGKPLFLFPIARFWGFFVGFRGGGYFLAAASSDYRCF